MFTLYLEYFNIFFFSYLFIFISPPFPFLLLLLSPHSHNHLLFVASIRPRWSCQSRLSAANLACPAAVLVAHPYHWPISPLIFGENFETFDWILGCEWRVWIFFLFANLRFLCVEFNWFLRNMMDFEFWKFIFSVILLTMCVVWVYGFQNLIYIILLNPYNVIEVAIFRLFCCCFCCCSWHQIFGF